MARQRERRIYRNNRLCRNKRSSKGCCAMDRCL
nr:MAG TPA: hypothetical protein [Caudoviricetes sp.]